MFGCVKKRLNEMFLLRTQNLFLIGKKLIQGIFGGLYAHIILTAE